MLCLPVAGMNTTTLQTCVTPRLLFEKAAEKSKSFSGRFADTPLHHLVINLAFSK